MKPSGIHHVAICVRDEDEALAFYRDVLGLTVLPRPDFGFGGYWLDAGGQQVHLMKSDDVARRRPPLRDPRRRPRRRRRRPPRARA